MNRLATFLLLGLVLAGAEGCGTSQGATGTVICSMPHDTSGGPGTTLSSRRPDLTGRTRLGKASFYAASFYHRKMADGQRMDPHGANAASRTLPLGTSARVTNLSTGQSAIVHIQDRGPYVKGRQVDLSPTTARKIGITRRIGVAPVKVAPITVPLPDGTVKAGAGFIKPVCRVS
ncbi:MAG TPA: septal ring lytic transglycosylase RlpA family protein [Steroidobacteraceae bacterium]|jgi:rare lipoprotein A|nr:septal ring lytic transglycosylase RlpA family protein [Steroidobacteraceae bacterium]